MTRTIDDILLQAAILYDQGEHQKALAELDPLLEQQPTAAAYHLRSRCHRALGDNQAALADLNSSLELEPNNADGYRERAQLHFLSKRPDLALVDNQLAEQYNDSDIGDEEEGDEPFVPLHDVTDEYDDDDDGDDDQEETEAEELFNRVYEAREEFFEDNFGPMPADVLKLNNMMGVWPGGCLVQIYAEALPDAPSVTSTFGLTNPDMPATVRSEDVVHEERTEGDRLLRSTSMRLVARDPVTVPPGIAGYGYEAMVITPEQFEWPSLFLSWFVTNEINHDAGWLRRVMQEEAVLLKCPLRDYPRLKLLLTKAAPPMADTLLLPNGMAYMLVATSITEAEYAFAMKAGAPALADAMRTKGPGQISIIFRPSCV